jgi:type III restriction enzyme
MQTLEQQISAAISMGFISIDIKHHIKNNLNPKFQLRPYQLEAFTRFSYYTDEYPNKLKPTQLLFHMATGSGKTLIMAGIILDLYEKGYRDFIFFVNSTNIIEKTKNNFINSISSKYLFSETISIADKQIEIKETKNFQTSNDDNINIVFTTIQGLHSRLNTPKENSLTYEDFEDKKIVLISDEAHHINTETKNGSKTKDEIDEIISWENTVNKIFNINADNYLLEFTATTDLSNPEIKNKYIDKLIFDYPLKQFRIDKYSKEVQVLQAELSPLERSIQAVILSQYRRKVFGSNKLNIKPVILFKSKRIDDSKVFFEEFIHGIKNLSQTKILKIRNNINNQSLEKAFKYFEDNNITIENLIAELKEDFSRDKCISVDSKNDSEEKQLIINSLEDENNEYRAIFAVDKLNEGWDVLNLFDIVRLYNTRDTDHKSGKVGKTTMSEAQLIGRGARYCPFQLSNSQNLYQRKFDDDLENNARICEELYYHSAHNPKYISELNKALEVIGIKASKIVQRRLRIKDEFKESNFYNSGIIYLNKKLTYDRLDILELDKSIRERIYKKKFLSGYGVVSKVFENSSEMKLQKTGHIHQLRNFSKPIIYKAINKLPFYRFNNLQRYFPHLKSIDEFICSDTYLNQIQVEIEGVEEQAMNPNNELKLETYISVLDEISKLIPLGSVEFKGTKTFTPQSISKTFKDKIINIAINEDSDKEYGIAQSETNNQDLFVDLSNEDWYVFNDNFGTSEEKYLVKYIKQAYSSLKDKFSEVFLIRNEKHFKLFNFKDGRAIEPDFVLFLKETKSKKSLIYQLFIEPKGKHLIENDIWKEVFLYQIDQECELTNSKHLRYSY